MKSHQKYCQYFVNSPPDLGNSTKKRENWGWVVRDNLPALLLRLGSSHYGETFPDFGRSFAEVSAAELVPLLVRRRCYLVLEVWRW